MNSEVYKLTGTKLLEIHRADDGTIDHTNVINRSGEILAVFWGESSASAATRTFGLKGVFESPIS